MSIIVHRKKMKEKVLLLFGTLALVFLLNSCIAGCLIRKSMTKDTFSKSSVIQYDTEASFEWSNEVINGKYYEKTAILIPVHFNNNIQDTFYLQFDSGIPQTLLYEKQLMIIANQDSSIKKNISFSNNQYYLHRPIFKIDGLGTLIADSIEIVRDRAEDGYLITNDSLAKKEKIDDYQTMIIGSFGHDLVLNRSCLLDFENTKISFLSDEKRDALKGVEYIKGAKTNRFPITIKTKINNKNYNLFYDSGSSLSDIALLIKDWNKIKDASIDTLCCFRTWGKDIAAYKKEKNNKVKIGKYTYTNVPIYTSEVIEDNKLAFKLLNIQGIISNPLFLNTKILIDSKRNKLGIIR